MLQLHGQVEPARQIFQPLRRRDILHGDDKACLPGFALKRRDERDRPLAEEGSFGGRTGAADLVNATAGEAGFLGSLGVRHALRVQFLDDATLRAASGPGRVHAVYRAYPSPTAQLEMTVWNADLIHRRLAEIQQQDPEHKIFGARRHHHRLGPRLSTRDVTAFERKIGVELPKSFRAFLTEVGNGGAGPFYGLYNLEEAFRLDAMEIPEGPLRFYTTPFPHTANWNPPLDALPEDYEEGRWITGSLLLAEFGCGAFHRLVVNGKVAGEVWFDDRCADGGMAQERDFFEWYMSWLDQPHRHRF